MDEQFHNLKFQKKKFQELVAKNFAADDRKKILRAFQFAVIKHKKQKRNEGTAYIIHPLRVAITLLDDVGAWDADVVAGALLHDVAEDCRVRLATIRKQFGRRTARFVDLLTRRRPRKESETEKERSKMESLARLRREPLEARLIKCSDILDNLRCAADMPWLSWTPMARKKFPRWRREFRQAGSFARDVHPIIFREIRKSLRTFELKCLMHGLVRFGF